MTKLRTYLFLSLLLFCIGGTSFASDIGISKRYTFVYKFGGFNFKSLEDERGHDPEPIVHTFYLGYALTNRLELGIGTEIGGDDMGGGGNQYSWREYTYDQKSLGTYAKFNIVNFSHFQLYAQSMLHYIFYKCDYKIYSSGHFIRPGFLAGFDFSIGRNKGFILGLEAGVLGLDINNRLASFSQKGYMYDIHIGWRFGKNTMVRKRDQDSINGMSAKEWKKMLKIYGGNNASANEASGIVFDSLNSGSGTSFGSYGNNWFGH